MKTNVSLNLKNRLIHMNVKEIYSYYVLNPYSVLKCKQKGIPILN